LEEEKGGGFTCGGRARNSSHQGLMSLALDKVLWKESRKGREDLGNRCGLCHFFYELLERICRREKD